MEDISLLIIILIITLVSTFLISLKKNIKKVFKYVPSLVIFAGGIIYSVWITIFDYNSYIAIVYLMVLATILPGIIVSLMTAILFDISYYNKNRKGKFKEY
ncbi:MAG: hypothetical protein Q8920_12420 [Bacillota bacterium]|nr:hypothetical protein [Bacillota bacterium]